VGNAPDGTSRYKGAWGGRGSGKSHFFAELMIEAHIMDQKRRSVCVREIQKSLSQSVKRLLEIKIQAMNAGAYFEVQDAVIKSKKADGAIIFQGMQNHTADSIKSLEAYDCAWVEEAQSLSQTSLDLLRPTIRKPDSELWFTWNPRQQSDPVDFLLRGPTPPKDASVIKVNFTDNPWFPTVLRDEMEYDKRRDPDKYQHVWMGEYLTNSNSRVFKNWVVTTLKLHQTQSTGLVLTGALLLTPRPWCAATLLVASYTLITRLTWSAVRLSTRQNYSCRCQRQKSGQSWQTQQGRRLSVT
jgi:phage terminase large subunit